MSKEILIIIGLTIYFGAIAACEYFDYKDKKKGGKK